MNNFKLAFLTFLLFLCSYTVASAYERDIFVDNTLSKYANKNLKTATPYCNYENLTKVKITLTPVEKITSAQARDGDIVEFIVKDDVIYNKQVILLKGTKVKGCVETVVTQGMNGIPAIIVLNNFEIPGIPNEKLKSAYSKKGLNLSYIVFPLKWALTFLPPTGTLTNFIIGGPAKLTPKTKINLYYYPEWVCIEP